MRHLAAMSSVREVGSDQYVHSKYSRELASNPMVNAFKFMYVNAVRDRYNLHTVSADALADTTTTGRYGETLLDGLRIEVGNTQMTYERHLRHIPGMLRTLLFSSTLPSIPMSVSVSEL